MKTYLQINSQEQISQLTEIVKQLMEQNKNLMQELQKQRDNSSTDSDSTLKRNSPFFRGRGRGRNIGTSRGMENTINTPMEKKLKIECLDEFPSLTPDMTYKQKLSNNRKDYAYHVKQYINNFVKIVEKLNTNPEEIYDENKGYSTISHEKINMLVALPGCKTNLIHAAYNYGLISTIYTKDGSEVASIPELYNVVKSYLRITKADMVYIRIYSAVAEVTYDNVIPVTRIIKIGITREYIIKTAKVQNVLKPEEIPQFLTKKRAWSFKVMSDSLKNIDESPFWLNTFKANTAIFTNASQYRQEDRRTLKLIYNSILQPEIEIRSRVIPKNFLTNEGRKQLCNIFKSEELHICKYCMENFEETPNINIDDEEGSYYTDTEVSEDTTEDLLGKCKITEE